MKPAGEDVTITMPKDMAAELGSILTDWMETKNELLKKRLRDDEEISTEESARGAIRTELVMNLLRELPMYKGKEYPTPTSVALAVDEFIGDPGDVLIPVNPVLLPAFLTHMQTVFGNPVFQMIQPDATRIVKRFMAKLSSTIHATMRVGITDKAGDAIPIDRLGIARGDLAVLSRSIELMDDWFPPDDPIKFAMLRVRAKLAYFVSEELAEADRREARREAEEEAENG